MPLLTLKEALQFSVDQRYAVGAFNIANYVMAEGVIRAAEEKGLPVIINIAEVHFQILDMDNFMHYLLDRVHRSPAPMVIHLDHGYTYENIIKAIHYGFTSVMFDGSKLPYKENVARTREIVRIAHAAGVSVEAELGHVAGLEGEPGRANEADTSVFTEPEEAERFVKETEIDALAVSIGTVHGVYKDEPRLDFARLKEIRKRVDIPLVLHGGTGLSREDFRKVIASGINKINFFTGNSVSAVEAVRKELSDKERYIDLPELILIAQRKVKEVTMEQMEIFGTRPLAEQDNP